MEIRLIDDGPSWRPVVVCDVCTTPITRDDGLAVIGKGPVRFVHTGQCDRESTVMLDTTFEHLDVFLAKLRHNAIDGGRRGSSGA